MRGVYWGFESLIALRADDPGATHFGLIECECMDWVVNPTDLLGQFVPNCTVLGNGVGNMG